MTDFSSRFAAAQPLLIDPDDPTYAGMPAESRAQALRNLAAMMPQGQPPQAPLIAGPQQAQPQQQAPQQVAQAGPPLNLAPQAQAAPPTQMPAQMPSGGSSQPPSEQIPNFFQQIAPPISGPMNPTRQMQQHMQNIQNFRQLMASLPASVRGYQFSG